MSIELLDNPGYYGFRVRRAINGTVVQEYYSLKEDRKRVTGAKKTSIRLIAEIRDEQLEKLQQSSKKLHKKQNTFRPNGWVKGVLYAERINTKGETIKLFLIGIKSELLGRALSTSRSVTKHGVEEAWNLTIDCYCKHKQIDKGSTLHHRLIGALNYYELD